MAVARDHYANSSRFWFQVKSAEVVDQVDRETLDFNQLGFGQRRCPRAPIHIAAHGGYGGEFAQAVENSRITYVSGVQNAMGATQGGDGFGPQQAVGVGDDADSHAFLAR